jgi:hypothetical protein
MVDVVVGRYKWQQDILDRAVLIGAQQLPVARRADLILLKLYAGGNQDRWDIEQLLAIDSSAETVASVDRHLEPLPARSRELWRTLRPAR